MNSIAEPVDRAHPAWCDGTEAAAFPAHSGQVGADIELTAEMTIGVFLWQQGDEPTVVQLMVHTPDETSMTKLSLLQAAILSDLVREGLGLAAREAGL